MESIVLKQKGNLVPVIAEIIGNFYKLSDDSNPVHLLAEQHLDLTELKDYIEALIDVNKPKLIEAKVYELFPEFDLHVAFREGAAKTAVDTKTLFEDLAAQNRIGDFVKVASVTQTELKKIDGGEALAAKHKVTLGKNADGVRVEKMTKEDWSAVKGQ